MNRGCRVDVIYGGHGIVGGVIVIDDVGALRESGFRGVQDNGASRDDEC